LAMFQCSVKGGAVLLDAGGSRAGVRRVGAPGHNNITKSYLITDSYNITNG
jgi:hypothetical protein